MVLNFFAAQAVVAQKKEDLLMSAEVPEKLDEVSVRF